MSHPLPQLASRLRLVDVPTTEDGYLTVVDDAAPDSKPWHVGRDLLAALEDDGAIELVGLAPPPR